MSSGFANIFLLFSYMADNQEKTIKNLIKGKGYTMEGAAVLLGIARQTLYNAIRKSPLDSDFVKTVNEKLGIRLNNLPIQVLNESNTEIELRKQLAEKDKKIMDLQDELLTYIKKSKK